MATTLMKGAEAAPDASEHPGHERGLDTGLHPWARAMSERGFNFNGGERTKLFLARSGDDFADVSDVTGADSPLDGRAILATDFDDDGDVDFFVHNIQRERHHLFRNQLDPKGGFLEVRLIAQGREAIGAVVTVDGPRGPVAQVLSRGAGFVSCQAPALHFGLGGQATARVRVRWPGATEAEDFGVVPAGERLVLVQGLGEARRRERNCATLNDPLAPGLKVPLGALLPPLDVLDAEGNPMRIDPARAGNGGPFELIFWASYCRPCVADLPRHVKEHRSGERPAIALSVDVPSDHPRARELVGAAGGGLPLAFVSMEDEANQAGLDLVIDLLRLPVPTVLTISAEGRLLAVRTGAGD
ncbi:MAG: ASPIC/UnbV domain-containing protein [Planctomycetota bacterium]